MRTFTTGGRVAGLIAVLSLVIVSAIVATAGSAASTDRGRALHVTKQCSDPPYDGTVGSFCTITSSNISIIKPGMRVVYLKALGEGVLDSDVALGFGDGTALGHVVLDLETASGPITFSAGTGKFRNFRARAAVSVDADGVWHWDGTYED